jgi:hypothetical protein
MAIGKIYIADVFLKIGGTSSQYLMSDGSVSNSSNKANVDSPTFTGTVILPTTTSIGNVSSTELSYIDGVTSNIQTQLNTKITANTSTNNYIPKVSGTNIFANSRIIDTGTYLGIGSVNTPTKDITLGNQLDREIGIEESDNTIIGKSLRISAGRTINYISNSNFTLLPQIVARSWMHIKGHPNGDTYAVASGFLYKQTNSAGEFVSITTGITGITGLYITSTSDIYICVNGGYCYKQTNSTGSFVQFGQIGNWNGIAVYNNIDVYTVTGWAFASTADYIYKQTGGVGNLVSIGVMRKWSSIDTSSSGVYATSDDGLYLQNGASGDFTLIRGGLMVYVAIDNANNLYLDEYIGGQYHIFKQTNSIGTFADLFMGHSDLWFRGIGFDKNNNVYVASLQQTIWYKQTYAIGAPDLAGGTLKVLSGTAKGTGISNVEIYTGQKTNSGTDMQVETLRVKINNEGLMTLPSVTNAIIGADVTGKAVVTKEYLSSVAAQGRAEQVNSVTSTAYTFQMTDAGNRVYVEPVSPSLTTILTIPTNLVVPFPIGTRLSVSQSAIMIGYYNKVVGSAGVTINMFGGNGSEVYFGSKYPVSFIKIGLDTWEATRPSPFWSDGNVLQIGGFAFTGAVYGQSATMYLGTLNTEGGTVISGKYRVTALNTAPASATATGTLGEIRYTADYVYVCIATNTWVKTALTTW